MTGLPVVGLGLLGVVLYYGLLTMFGVEQKTMLEAPGLSFGASSSHLSRVSAVSSTKGADVGADRGQGRSPASQTTRTSRRHRRQRGRRQRVGDCAGMAADLFGNLRRDRGRHHAARRHLLPPARAPAPHDDVPLLIGGVHPRLPSALAPSIRLGSDNSIHEGPVRRGLTVAAYFRRSHHRRAFLLFSA